MVRHRQTTNIFLFIPELSVLKSIPMFVLEVLQCLYLGTLLWSHSLISVLVYHNIRHDFGNIPTFFAFLGAQRIEQYTKACLIRPLQYVWQYTALVAKCNCSISVAQSTCRTNSATEIVHFGLKYSVSKSLLLFVQVATTSFYVRILLMPKNSVSVAMYHKDRCCSDKFDQFCF